MANSTTGDRCRKSHLALAARIDSCPNFQIQDALMIGLLKFSKHILAALALVALSAASLTAGERLTLNFNPDWKFTKSDEPKASSPEFDDKAWTSVSAPHTYNDVDTFDNFSLAGHRGEQDQWSGRTWYRKTFTAPDAWKGKKVFIEFEGVRQVAEIYLNGELLGVSKTGFTPFGFDLTKHLQFGKPNVLAVMCDNRFRKDPDDPAAIEASNKSGVSTTKKDAGAGGGLAARLAKENADIPEKVEDLQANQIPWNNPHWHPAHGGIYRNVKLIVTDPVHITLPLYSFLQTEGPYVYATDISDKSAKITVEVPLKNEAENAAAVEIGVKVYRDVFPKLSEDVLSETKSIDLKAGAQEKVVLSGTIQNPDLWEPSYPSLYRVVCTVRDKSGNVLDKAQIPLGIRNPKWDVKTGFAINGNPVKLHGWGQKPTDEWPGLGAAQPNWLHFYTLQLMRDGGGNFVRWGHSAAGPAQIDACDRLGIIVDQPGVDGESDTVRAAWKLRADAFRDTLIYFRNNPSILVWEGGNQKVTREHAKELREAFDKYDPHGGRGFAFRRADKTDAEFMTVGVGTEGGQEIKELPVFEGEYDREEAPRRAWDDKTPRPAIDDPSKTVFGYPEGKGQTYQLTQEQYAANEVSHYVGKLGAASHSGGGNWIFSDSTSGGRVASEVARASGEVDGVRLPKEAFYVCRAMFSDEPQAYIIGHWNYPKDTKKNVYVASNGDEVELFVNGKSVGEGKQSDQYLFTFSDVAFEPGEVKAIARLNGKEIATDSKHTVGPAVALKLTPIAGPAGGLQADGSDVVLVDVEAVDAKGERVPTFFQRADFELKGPGVWRGGYNSGKEKSINNTYLDLECGINRVAIRSTRDAGKLELTAKTDGLKPTTLAIESHAVKIDGGVSSTAPAMQVVALPKERKKVAVRAGASAAGKPVAVAEQHGKFIKGLSYSGPTKGIRVETEAAMGKKIYSDRDEKFGSLPAVLRGADWIQAPQADRLYNAVDLMEIPVAAGATIFIAHDNRLDRPDWLTSGFKPTGMTLTIDGQPMKVFEHHADKDQSLTLGTNTENAKAAASNMYIVFVNAAENAKK
jgi:beta-galactosidase